MILGIVDKLNEIAEPFKDFIMNNHNNPLLWLGLFLIGLVIFWATYSALNKDN